ncbi:MAG: hypothetical protein R6V17_07570 [Halanaerobacter sp.]
MIDFKKTLVSIVSVFLILVFTSTPILAQDSYEIPFDKLKTPTKLQDIIDTFDRLKYDFKAFNEGEKVQELSIEFQYQGKEEVQGEEADKISIETSTMQTVQTSQMIFWLNDGEIIKMVQNKQQIPLEMANAMKDKMLQSVFFPFYHFDELDLGAISSTGKVTKSQEMIGEKEVDITEIEGDDLAEYGLESGTIKLADFDKFMMAVSFDYITLEEHEAQYKEGRFEVKEIELR